MPNVEAVNRIVEQLGQRKPLFVVLDAARDKALFWRLAAFCPDLASLLAGNNTVHLAQVAPYLASAPVDPQALAALVHSGWGNSCLSFYVSQRPFLDVWRHLRKLLIAQPPTGQPVYFRFYDPRVARKVFATYREQDRGAVWGPLDAILVESEDGNELVSWERTVPPAPLERFTLGTAQVGALRLDAATKYLARAEATLKKDWPEKFAEMGAEKTQRYIKDQTAKAIGYGITAEDDIVQYINLTLFWSPDFDVSPETNWAGSILNRKIAGHDKVHLLKYCSVEQMKQTQTGR